VEERALRNVHDLFGFWAVCREGRCRRARACRGDVHACSGRHWPHVPGHMKTWLRSSVNACRDGASPEEAMKIADEAEAQALAVTVPGAASTGEPADRGAE
jgi:hypothetical protein